MDNPATHLFVQRAQMMQTDFRLTEDNQAAIAQICAVVDGLPLGVELAAAWVQSLTCEQIAHYIKENLDLLTTEYHDIPLRQRSLRAVFESAWSCLNEAEQALLLRLGCFAGGFTLQAASHIAAATPWTLNGLVSKSLLQRVENGRYHLAETLRLYIREKLQQTAVVYESLNQSHSLYYLQLVQQHMYNPQALAPEADNIRVAWLWATSHQQFSRHSRDPLTLMVLLPYQRALRRRHPVITSSY